MRADLPESPVHIAGRAGRTISMEEGLTVATAVVGTGRLRVGGGRAGAVATASVEEVCFVN